MYLDHAGIEKLLEQFDKDAKAIKFELLKMCWFMRGGLSYGESFQLCVEDREIISHIIEENLKTTKESGLPFF